MGDNKRSTTTRVCDLCSEAVARVRCESDEAALCWNCDAAVHGANFLVARHVRVLMCRACFGLTPWLASGARVGPAASLCRGCAEREEFGGEGEGEGENQVVPLKLAPPVSDDDDEEAESGSSALHADDDLSCSSTQRSDSRSTEAESNVAEHEVTSCSSDRNRQRSRLGKRSYARTLVHASPSSNY